MRIFTLLISITVLFLTGCRQTAAPPPAEIEPTRLPGIILTPDVNKEPVATPTIYLHIILNNAQLEPVWGDIIIYWPDSGGEFRIGPTAEQRLPIPLDTDSFIIRVEAPGYRPVSQTVHVAGEIHHHIEQILAIVLQPLSEQDSGEKQT
jgi:hypothetical protein